MVIIKCVIVLMPWVIKRWLLQLFFKYEIAPNAYIGLSWVFPRKIIMEPNSYIGHFNIAIHLDLVHLFHKAKIGRSNWITGLSSGNSSFFQHQPGRLPALILKEHSAITKNHHIDCTNKITVGAYSIVGGYYSQFLSHSVDIIESRQDSAPIEIGNYCFIGTNVVILGGSRLPDYSVLGAKSLLNKHYNETYMLYAGVPAKPVQEIDRTAKFFYRKEGYIH